MTGQTLATIFPTLTRMRCECELCAGAEYVDEVGLMIVEDAVRTYARELRGKAREREDAFADAQRVMDDALKGGG